MKTQYTLLMHTKYTTEQQAEFSAFCARHDMRFNTLFEFHAAIDQYFTKD